MGHPAGQSGFVIAQAFYESVYKNKKEQKKKKACFQF